MRGLKKLGASALLIAIVAGTTAGHISEAAVSTEASSVYLDGKKLTFTADPVAIEGATLVPMRAIFEAQGAKVFWDNKTQTVSAAKGSTNLTYQIGQAYAYRNQDRIPLASPGRIIAGSTMVPLRFMSELLGNVVQWHGYSGSITISSATAYENTVDYGVNLRTVPSSQEGIPIYRMLAKGEKIHVIREIDANWLEVQTQDKHIGFVSAKPMYTNYRSPQLAERQAAAIIAFGSQYLGTPYEFGASSNQTATFDCSSFVRHLFSEVLSIDLPRVSYDQATQGIEVGWDALRPGDLLFFKARGLDIGHVGIYVGNNQILHTYSKEKGVHFMELDEKWKKRFVTARRVL